MDENTMDKASELIEDIKESKSKKLKSTSKNLGRVTRGEFKREISAHDKLIEEVRATTNATADVLVQRFSELKGVLNFGLTRLEAALDILEESGIITDAKMRRAYERLTEYQESVIRITNLPPKERIEEVKKWNKSGNVKPINMGQVGIFEYLIQNPDNLPTEERLRLAEEANAEQPILDRIRLIENDQPH